MPPGDRRTSVHPLHAILLAFPIALFTAALASDIAYLNSAEMQWSNFASWLIAGALLMGAPVVGWAAIGVLFPRADGQRGQRLLYLAVLVMMWVAGLINAFQHSHDGWASVGGVGLSLSILSTLAAFAAGIIAHIRPTLRETAR